MSRNTHAAETAATAVGHKGVISAVITAIYDRFSNKGQLDPSSENERLDGKTCLITGANSGLGKATAVALAKRGAHVILACRSGHPEAGEEIKELSGSNKVDMIKVDLSDLLSVNRLCDQLRDQGVCLDLAVMNAGLMPLNARRSPQGFELMFAVHFLANRLMLERWLTDGIVKPNASQPPRVIFVASEAHKSADPIDFNKLGEFTPYGMKDGMKHYGATKLMLCTFVAELSRRVNLNDSVALSVNALCPGPIASNIARESPALLKPILRPIMRLFFRSPEQAAEPVIYLACSRSLIGRTGIYLHMMREKPMSILATDIENGKMLWQRSASLLQPYRNKQLETA